MTGDNNTSGHQQRYNWSVRHPFHYENQRDAVAVVVSPWRGLLSRWRFVLPAEYQSKIVAWGIIAVESGQININPRGSATSNGAVRMKNGPNVVWMGATQPLSKQTGGIIIFNAPAPHYVMFGQADTTTSPPGSMEGLTFGAPHDHPINPA